MALGFGHEFPFCTKLKLTLDIARFVWYNSSGFNPLTFKKGKNMQKIHDVEFDKVFFNYPTTAIETRWPVGNSGRYYQGVVICVAKKGDKCFIGVAKCVDPDQFNKKIGREIAFGRAEKAYYNSGIRTLVSLKCKQCEREYMGIATMASYRALHNEAG